MVRDEHYFQSLSPHILQAIQTGPKRCHRHTAGEGDSHPNDGLPCKRGDLTCVSIPCWSFQNHLACPWEFWSHFRITWFFLQSKKTLNVESVEPSRDVLSHPVVFVGEGNVPPLNHPSQFFIMIVQVPLNFGWILVVMSPHEKTRQLSKQTSTFHIFLPKLGRNRLTEKPNLHKTPGRRSWPMWRSGFSQRPWAHYCRPVRPEGMDLLGGVKLGFVEKATSPIQRFSRKSEVLRRMGKYLYNLSIEILEDLWFVGVFHLDWYAVY